MKWILSHTEDGIHQWQLQQEDKSKRLIVHPQRLSLRLIGTSKRLFFLDVQGFLHKKIFLRNEYGVEMGETAFTENPDSGDLLLNGQNYSYTADDRQLALFDSENNLLATSEIAREPALETLELYSLLFGLAWFITADGLTEKDREISTTA